MDDLLGGNLFPIPKGEDDVRPIAVTESFTRLACKCAALLTRTEAAQALGKRQFGCHTKAGVEALTLAMRVAIQRHPEMAVAKLDFKTAFQAVDRSFLLSAVAEACPCLFPVTRALYEKPSELYWCLGRRYGYKAAPFRSANGTRQGCPLSPVLFSIALKKIIDAANETGRVPLSCLVTNYLDDIQICGPPLEVAEAMNVLREVSHGFGLRINPDKCSLYCQHLPHGFQPPRWLQANLLVQDGIVILGVPISRSVEFVEHVNHEWLAKQRGHMERILELPPQVACDLIRLCLLPRIGFRLRTQEPRCSKPLARGFDDLLRYALQRILGLASSDGLTDEAWSLAQLPSNRSSGIGFRSSLATITPAVIGSWQATSAVLFDRFQEVDTPPEFVIRHNDILTVDIPAYASVRMEWNKLSNSASMLEFTAPIWCKARRLQVQQDVAPVPRASSLLGPTVSGPALEELRIPVRNPAMAKRISTGNTRAFLSSSFNQLVAEDFVSNVARSVQVMRQHHPLFALGGRLRAAMEVKGAAMWKALGLRALVEVDKQHARDPDSGRPLRICSSLWTFMLPFLHEGAEGCRVKVQRLLSQEAELIKVFKVWSQKVVEGAISRAAYFASLVLPASSGWLWPASQPRFQFQPGEYRKLIALRLRLPLVSDLSIAALSGGLSGSCFLMSCIG